MWKSAPVIRGNGPRAENTNRFSVGRSSSGEDSFACEMVSGEHESQWSDYR